MGCLGKYSVKLSYLPLRHHLNRTLDKIQLDLETSFYFHIGISARAVTTQYLTI